MSIETQLTRRMGIEAPVVLAPMAGVSGGALAAAVGGAGGLVFIGGGYGDLKWIERELEIAGDTRVGAGLVTWAIEGYVLDAVLDREPAALFLSFGEFGPYAERIKRLGIPLFAQVQNVAQAKAAAASGADFIVAQGTEAGGHTGRRATLALVPAVKDAVGDVPVLAAGGIADGRGLAASLMLGAEGVVCGSVFYASAESLAHPQAKQAAVAASGDDTELRAIFDVMRDLAWPDQWKLRALANRFSRELSDAAALNDLSTLRARYEEAVRGGDFDIAAVIIGEAADLIGPVAPAAEILKSIVVEAEALLREAPRYVAE